MRVPNKDALLTMTSEVPLLKMLLSHDTPGKKHILLLWDAMIASQPALGARTAQNIVLLEV